MHANNNKMLMTRLRSLPAMRLRAVMLGVALLVASAQVAIAVHTVDMHREAPGHICVICLLGSGMVGLSASLPRLSVPLLVTYAAVFRQPDDFYSFHSHRYFARGPPAGPFAYL